MSHYSACVLLFIYKCDLPSDTGIAVSHSHFCHEPALSLGTGVAVKRQHAGRKLKMLGYEKGV